MNRKQQKKLLMLKWMAAQQNKRTFSLNAFVHGLVSKYVTFKM